VQNFRKNKETVQKCMKLLHLGNTSMDLKAFPIKRAKGHKIINAAAADVLNTSNAIFSLFQK